MIVIFEGPDAAGKDFVRAAFEQETKYENTVVTRFFFSQAVYARYFRRWSAAEDEEYVKLIRDFMFRYRPLVVFCHALPAVLDERIRCRGEDVDAQPNAAKVMELYEDLFEELGIDERVIRLDTSSQPEMDAIVERIVGKIKSLKRRK